MTGGKSPRQRGDYFERQTKRDLETRGWLVIRAGGSLGPCDLMAITNGQPPLLVSCKLGGIITPRERNMLIVIGNRYGATVVVASRPRAGVVEYTHIRACDERTRRDAPRRQYDPAKHILPDMPPTTRPER